jgi:YbgC/YbaW family acyl-CoA thioester hydrolase
MKLPMPEKFACQTEIPVRITDLNYGGHVGNDAILAVVHEARVRFLAAHGFSEMNAGGAGMIMADAVVVYRSQAFYGDTLTIATAVADLGSHGWDFVHRVTTGTGDRVREVARVKTAMISYDSQTQKIVAVPEPFRAVLAAAQAAPLP